jgi:hypothetical protein
MDEMEEQLRELLASTRLSEREYQGRCIDDDIEALDAIQACLNQLPFDRQRWAITELAYRWAETRATLHDDAFLRTGDAAGHTRFVETFLGLPRVASRAEARALIGDARAIVDQAWAGLRSLDVLAQPWALASLIREYAEAWQERYEEPEEPPAP